MYIDHKPPSAPLSCPAKIIVIEKTDLRESKEERRVKAEEFKEMGSETTLEEGPDDPTYWTVFAWEPRHAWDFTNESLPSAFAPLIS